MTGTCDSTSSSDEEEIDVVFHFPQLENLADGHFNLCDKSIEICSLLGDQVPAYVEYTPPQGSAHQPNKPEENSWTQSLHDHVHKPEARDEKIMIRIGELLFQGYWKDSRFFRESKRRQRLADVHDPLGTRVMIEIPQDGTTGELQTAPLDPDNVKTAVFQRILLTDDIIDHIRNVDSDSD